jgi:hypothetical protein
MGKSIKDIPFWGCLADCYPNLPNLVEMIRANDDSVITDEQWWAIARYYRGALLFESDWTQVLDNSLSQEKRAEWQAYRETLRNITSEYLDPRDIVFPDLPSK